MRGIFKTHDMDQTIFNKGFVVHGISRESFHCLSEQPTELIMSETSMTLDTHGGKLIKLRPFNHDELYLGVLGRSDMRKS